MITKGKIGLRAVEKADLHQLKEWRNNPDFRKHFREIRELSDANQERWFENLNQDSNVWYKNLEIENNKLQNICSQYVDLIRNEANS